jgi:Uma2 family endonuclease
MSVRTDLVFESTSTLTQAEFFDWLLTRPPSDCRHYELLHELPSGDTVEPDFAFIAAQRWDAIPPPPAGRFLRIVPDLVVEILSRPTAARDRGEKRDICEENGVREYWIIEPETAELTVFSRREGRFDRGRILGRGTPFDSEVLLGLRFDVGSVLPG